MNFYHILDNIGTSTECIKSYWPLISEISGTISFLGSFVSLFPQIIETYRDKSVAGLSPYFLLCWLCGDITSLTGAIMTHQLQFQIILAIYFLLNDSFVCGQYYYYGIMYKNSLATVGHEPVAVLSNLPDNEDHNSRTITTEDLESLIDNGHDGDIERTVSRGTSGSNRSRRDLLIAAVTIAKQVNLTSAMTDTPLSSPLPYGGHNNGNNHNHNSGIVLSWLGALFYISGRIPQLIKNYQRKSTDGLSPLLFATTLLCNITYCISIFTSCKFIDSNDKWQFFNNALPFIIGSAGTIIFDLIYFYQYYVLYSSDTKLRAIEREIYQEEEESSEENEDTPLLISS